jgi:uncharacterized protein YlxP (DUF503 family)
VPTVIALLTLDIHIPDAHSLKDKRMVIRKLKDRLRSNFNVSVSETEHQELWQRSLLSVVTVGAEDNAVRQTLEHALNDAERSAPECMIQGNIEII